MNTADYIQTSLFKKFNECVFLSRKMETTGTVDNNECLKMGQLIQKDVINISKPLHDAVSATNARLLMTLQEVPANNFNAALLASQRVMNATNAETEAWKMFEEPNKHFLASVGYVRISNDVKPSAELNPLVMVAAMGMAFFFLTRMSPKKKKSDKETGKA